MTLFNYEVAYPTNVIEASASTEPDDISYAYLRIEATVNTTPANDPVNPGKTPDADGIVRIRVGDLRDIRFIVPVSLTPSAAALTRNPNAITPQPAQFGRWTFVREGPAGQFIAHAPAEGETPLPADHPDRIIAVAGGAPLIFYLYDIPVIDHDGVAAIHVEEIGDGPPMPYADPEEQMRVRKVMPTLRIDHFSADLYQVTAGAPVTLSWATSGPRNTTVTLWDDNGSTVLEASQKDGSQQVNPTSTTIYTLVASAPNHDVMATRQLLVTVSDQLKAARLIVGQDNPTAAGSVDIQTNKFTMSQVDNRNLTHKLELTPDSIRISRTDAANTNETRSGSLHVDMVRSQVVLADGGVLAETGIVSGGIVAGRGAVPAGAIMMWNGSAKRPSEAHNRPVPDNPVPPGWVLCDAERDVVCWDGWIRTVPNLSDRFILGQSNSNLIGHQDGAETVALTTDNMPAHSHSTTVTIDLEAEAGGHTHDVSVAVPLFDVSAPDVATNGPMIFLGSERNTKSATGSASSSGAHTHDISVSIGDSGSNPVIEHDNMPPFYVLAFIMYHGMEELTLAPAPEGD